MIHIKHDMGLIITSFIVSVILAFILAYIFGFIASIYPFKKYVASRSFIKSFSKHSAHVATQNSAFSMTYKLMFISAIIYLLFMFITIYWRKCSYSSILNLLAKQLLQALTIYGLTLSIGTGVLIIRHVFFGTLSVMAIPPLMFLFFYLELWTKISLYQKRESLLNSHLNRIVDKLHQQTHYMNIQVHNSVLSDSNHHCFYVNIMNNLKLLNENVNQVQRQLIQNNNENNMHGILWKLLHLFPKL